MCTYFVIYVRKSLTIQLRGYDIQAQLEESYSSAQIFVVKTILLHKQSSQIHRFFISDLGDWYSSINGSINQPLRKGRVNTKILLYSLDLFFRVFNMPCLIGKRIYIKNIDNTLNISIYQNYIRKAFICSRINYGQE